MQVQHNVYYAHTAVVSGDAAGGAVNAAAPAAGGHRRMATIEGDAEANIEIVDDLEKSISSAMIAVLFSVNDYNQALTDAEKAIVSEFFTSMKWEIENPQVAKVEFAAFMN